jgi:hypothetical protein
METANAALTFIALYVGHMVGDHWAQTDCQARDKGRRGEGMRTRAARSADMRAGQWACLKHVIGYTITQVVVLALAGFVPGHQVSWTGLLASLTFSAVTHYAVDRRYTLEALARVLGKSGFYSLGVPRADRDDNPSLGTGAYALDQSAHLLCLFVSAILAVSL